MSENINTRRVGEKFRIRIEMLDEKYTDHWESEWVLWGEYELPRGLGLDLASRAETLSRLTLP